ncbi:MULTISPECIES: hypothetical protein [Microbulbifer]|uniref:DUF3313 domain-containing protein n=1 Tax=Microbulbifer celer TaxID=435905 RepID=A0ABW3U9M5_9GAMM|nr:MULTISPECIES: hypothetical protein [Microbulbifer]UFN57468.1 hypothetical protein LPW13_00035 [Microbulbifer celer]
MMNMRFLKVLFAAPLVLTLMAGCAQQPSAEDQAAIEDGLVPKASGLDSVSAAFAFDLSGAKVYMEPLSIDYNKRFARASSPFREADYRLDEKDRAKLQALIGETLGERFLAPRNSELVTDRSEADYVMQLDLRRFSIAAPLEPSAGVWRVYADQSAWGVLSGELLDSQGNPVMRFSDRREMGDNFGSLGPNRFDRFNRVTFWADMRTDLRRAFRSLDKTLQ